MNDEILREIISLQSHPWYTHFIQYINTQIEWVENSILQRDTEKNKIQFSEYDILRDNRSFLYGLRDTIEDIKSHYEKAEVQPRTDV